MRKSLGMGVVLCLSASFAGAQERAVHNGWTMLEDHPLAVRSGEPWIRPGNYRAITVERPAMGALLAKAPLEFTAMARQAPLPIELPRPDGTTALFTIVESPVMEPGLAALLPDVKTYCGQGVDNPAETVRLDMTPQGLHAQVLSPEGAWYIDPFTKGDNVHHSSYYARSIKRAGSFECQTLDEGWAGPGLPQAMQAPVTLRTYRLACSATGEFTAFHGSQANAQAAIVTMVNRITGVYEQDFAVRLVLVANNINVVYPTGPSDPYTTPSNPSTTNNQLQTALDGAIGSANYDIGHVVHNGSNNGLAGGIGTVCVAGTKGKGYTSVTPPVGDVLAIDYAAHEMGHQFGGRHTFNSCGGGPGDDALIAHEPGSGSTIMAYAGICGSDNLQPNSDPYFASINLDQILAYVAAGGTCSVNGAVANSTPTANAGPNYTIPRSTPFTLDGSGADPEGDALTFSWEQRNGGPAVPLATFSDNGQAPIARVFNPTTSDDRTIPRPANLLSNTFYLGEILPTTTRTMTWRLVARDNHAGGGGIGTDDMALSSVSAAGPFTVTSPSGAAAWTGLSSQTITWNVAGTTANGINCANVAILFSTDGGNTFPTTILASTPNDGSQTITVPNLPTTQGRIKVAAVGNIFFNINQGGMITVNVPNPGVDLAGTGVNTFTDTTGNGNNNGLPDPGETDIRVTVGVQNIGLTDATGVTGTLSSLTGTVGVTTAGAAYPDLSNSGGSGSNATPYVISVSAGHPCGDPINLRLTMNSAESGGAQTYDFSFGTGVPGGPGPQQTFSYTTPAVAIPDNNVTGVFAELAVAGVSGNITDVDFRFDGPTCNTVANSTTVGLNHDWIGDLVVTLRSPQGTTITLTNRPGGAGNSGHNFCNATLDDAAVSPISGVTAAQAPYTGSWRPDQVLSTFNGQNPNGTWRVTVADVAAVDTGSLRRFSIIVRGQSPSACDPPNPCVSPTIDTDTQDVLTCTNADAVYFFGVSGVPAPTYQWRHEGFDIADGPSGNGSTYSGTNTDTLTVSFVTPADQGHYDCVVTNDCGANQSYNALLTIGGDIDFNNDQIFPDFADLEDFLNVFGGGGCSNDPNCDDIDFNDDQIFPDFEDLQDFLNVFAGGIC